ncbi:MAG: AarF/ABC1/UbiB kinase family protein [Acidobacteria bacterium]|nr:AarF/ABC1/UbiB kinase family protein [Acidobacteriota bacterium]MCB9396531.1 AarF/ABC1/UbiB kinase family protein [Acidobacteriota bacterium]
MRISNIGRTYQHVQRLSQIARILIRNGFGDLVQRLNIDQYFKLGLRLVTKRAKIEQLSRSERIRAMLEELGPTFIKLGQMLSTRSDLLPMDLIEDLATLQDDIAPFPSEQAKKIVEEDLGASIASIFQTFEVEPLAAASIGQVHRAQLHTGEKVVVKIQRPGIRRKIRVDLEIMTQLAQLIERQIEELASFKPSQIVDQFGEAIQKELDFYQEASNLEQFRRTFHTDERIHVPKVYSQFCSDRLLVMEYVDGTKPTDPISLIEKGIDPKKIAQYGAELILEQIFLHRFFHADPHPGNILALKGDKVCFLDFGNMGRLERTKRDLVADLLIAVFRRDEERAGHILLRLLRYESDQMPPDFLNLVAEIIDRFAFQPLEELQVDQLVRSLFNLLHKAGLALPSDLFLLLKSLTLAEGLGRKLDPDYPFAEKAAPIIRKVKLERFSPKRLKRDLAFSGGQMALLLQEVPGEIREILKQVKRGKVHMEFEHRGLGPMIRSNERIANRIASSITLAAMIVGSSLIVLSGIPPKWHDIPVIGIVGFLASGIMGIGLLNSIRKSKTK